MIRRTIIVTRSDTQWRKSNVWNVLTVQQDARFKKPGIRLVVCGHFKPFLLMKQNDRADLGGISRDITPPGSECHEMLRAASLHHPGLDAPVERPQPSAVRRPAA